MKNNKLDRKWFFENMVQTFIRAIPKGENAIQRQIEGYKKLLDNQIKQTPECEADCRACMEMLDRAVIIFSDIGVRQMIIENNVTARQFISKFGEKILGDNKRKYDMSDRFREDMISYRGENSTNKDIQYVPRKESSEFVFDDMEGNELSIMPIGELHYKAWNGLRNQITKYRITRKIEEGLYTTYEVYTNISIARMEDLEYREVVLNELLGQNNIELSNAGGYIGRIIRSNRVGSNFKVGEQKEIAGDYFYKINKDYMILYDSEELAATVLQKKKEENNGIPRSQYQNSRRNKIISFPEVENR